MVFLVSSPTESSRLCNCDLSLSQISRSSTWDQFSTVVGVIFNTSLTPLPGVVSGRGLAAFSVGGGDVTSAMASSKCFSTIDVSRL
eukprot:Skav219477  [mRNA]  locus=scaffold2719:122714:124426:- [translate_table: standard]